MRGRLPPSITLSTTLVAAAFAAAPAGAAAPPAKQPTFALAASGSSGALLMRGTPGADLDGALAVRNLAGHPVMVRLQPADIRNATNGNADYVTSKLAGDGRWLRLQTATVRLAVGATERVKYTVSVPRNASGASHYAGIVGVDLADLAPEPAKAKRGGKPSVSCERVNRLAVPITVRLPGPREHRLALRSAGIEAVPAGAGLILGLRPEGSELIPQTEVELEVTRGRRVILTHDATLGQLFPDAPLDYRIPWEGRPTEGEYRVVGELRPQGAPAVVIDRTITFTSDVADELESKAVPGADVQGLPLWMAIALGCAGALVIVSLVAVLRMKRRLATAAPSG
jgi:hypothetical protein